MAKALRELETRIRKVQVVIEVRDARIPLSSGNPVLSRMVESSRKQHLLVFNKADLADPRREQALRSFYRDKEVAFVSSERPGAASVKRLSRTLMDMVHPKFKTVPAFCLCVGFPNVGKSSLLNALRVHARAGGSIARVAPHPGVTRHIGSFLISKEPLVALYDSPGVMLPNFEEAASASAPGSGRQGHLQELLAASSPGDLSEADAERARDSPFILELEESMARGDDLSPAQEFALKLGLTGAIKDSVVGELVLADYMLRVLNKHGHGRPAYCEPFRVAPTDSLEELLHAVAQRIGALRSTAHAHSQEERRRIEAKRAARYLIKLFREGELGRMTLDDIPARKTQPQGQGYLRQPHHFAS